MKVLYTIADLQPESGGPSYSVSKLASAVAELGIEVELLAQEYGDGSAAPVVPTQSVRTTLVPCRGALAQKVKWSRAFASVLQHRCETTNAELLLHDTGLWLPTNHAAAKVCREFKLPLIVSPRGMLTQWALHHKGWKKRIAWRLYQRRDLQSARVLHATSPAEVQDFRAAGLKQPIAMIPNGVELPPITEKAENRKQKTDGGSQMSDVRTVLFLGRIHPKKGLINLVQAWAMLQGAGSREQGAKVKNWRVVVAGGDEKGHSAEIKAESRKLKVEMDFEFVGAVEGEAKWDLFRKADLFVLPSHSENFGLVVAEALASGVPVIASRGTPWEDLITHRCGWLVDNQPKILADALMDVMNLSDDERRAMGKRGRELVERKYSWPGIAAQMKSVYEWMSGLAVKPNSIV